MNAAVLVTGSFDDLRLHHVRCLHAAARLGAVHVRLWSDADVRRFTGATPKFPEAERLYLVQSVRYVQAAALTTGVPDLDSLPLDDVVRPDCWVVDEASDHDRRRAACAERGIGYRVLRAADLADVPMDAGAPATAQAGRRKIVVTGCYDWLHSGHVRFFEECAALGDLYVVVGHDANVRLLKGAGHPLFPQEQRRYMAQAIRFVTQALVSTGHGWLDAEPEIARIHPDCYAVNEDGDKPEKREFCARAGIEYVVLRRLPKPGLPRRESTVLRGF